MHPKFGSHPYVKSYDGVTLKLLMGPKVVEAFKREKIFFGRQNRQVNQRPVIAMHAKVPLEPFACYSVGKFLFTMGAFSYSESELPFGVKVGRYCSIAKGLEVFSDRHPYEWVTSSSINYDFKPHNGYGSFVAAQAEFNDNKFLRTEPANKKGPAPVIGNDVWVGQNVQFARGITIGDGAVVAAGAVVVKDVEPYSIVGGVPARHLKYRFSPDIIEGLTRAKWWEHDPSIFQHYDLKSPETFVRDWHSGGYRSPYNPELVTPDKILQTLAG